MVIKNKRKYVVLPSIIILIIMGIITYLGRIHFPENFQPETVSFFENYYVLVLGFCFVITIFSLCFGLLWYFGKEIIKEIKSLFKNNTLKHKKKTDFYKNLISDWGRDDIYGPWNIYKNNNEKFQFYKSYYLIDGGEEPDIDTLNE